MLEPRTTPSRRPRRRAALLLALGLLVAAVAVPLAAQPAEEPPAAPAVPAAPAAPEVSEVPEPQEIEPPEVEPQEIEPPAAPEPPRSPRSRRNDAQVIVGSSLVVEQDETTDDVVVVGGSLTVLGEVYGDATAIGGSVTVVGRVTGDVSSVGGSVSVAEGGEILGGAMSFGGSVDRDEGGVIAGEVVEVTRPGFHWALWPGVWSWGDWDGHRGNWLHVSPFDWAWSQAWRIFGLAVLLLVACLALLVGRTPIERIGRRIEAEPWKSGLVGLATQILFVPLLIMLIVILAVSIIGIPFLLLLPFALVALVIVIFFGYVGVALKLGDLLRERFGWSIQSPYVVLLVGILGLRVWSLIGNMIDVNGPPLKLFAGLFMVFGFLVGYIAWTLATGGALLTRFGTAESWSREPAGPPPALPAAAPPPQPSPPPPAAPPAAPTEPPAEGAWEPEIDAEEGREG